MLVLDDRCGAVLIEHVLESQLSWPTRFTDTSSGGSFEFFRKCGSPLYLPNLIPARDRDCLAARRLQRWTRHPSKPTARTVRKKARALDGYWMAMSSLRLVSVLRVVMLLQFLNRPPSHQPFCLARFAGVLVRHSAEEMLHRLGTLLQYSLSGFRTDF